MFPVNVIGDAPSTQKKINIESEGSIDQWSVPEETPVAFVYNRRNYAVMLATPQDMIDYAVGFSLTERVIDRVNDVQQLDILYTDRGVDLRVSIEEKLLERFDLRQRRRNLPGVAGCGVCGLENADEFFETLPRVAKTKVSLSPEMIARAFDALSDNQPLNQNTRSVHAAAWVDKDGAILHLREDVGRHNALDKLLGALAYSEANVETGFVLMSSRCSYELVRRRRDAA